MGWQRQAVAPAQGVVVEPEVTAQFSRTTIAILAVLWMVGSALSVGWTGWLLAKKIGTAFTGAIQTHAKPLVDDLNRNINKELGAAIGQLTSTVTQLTGTVTNLVNQQNHTDSALTELAKAQLKIEMKLDQNSAVVTQALSTLDEHTKALAQLMAERRSRDRSLPKGEPSNG